jgi:hypothetical protein
MRVLSSLCAALVAVACGAASVQAAPIIFADFNVDEGTFNLQPSFSGTNANVSTASTADRDTSVALEGEGSQKFTFIRSDTPSAAGFRVRHLSGSGNPGSNTTFTTGPGEDGYIGFYLRVDELVGSLQVQIALDGPGNTGAEMDGGVGKNVIADGQWHLYEWNLDDPADWAAVSGIGGTSPVDDGDHTIDSIMFFGGGNGPENEVKMVGYLDFIAKSDSGSIAALVPPSTIPEPTSVALVGLAGLGLVVAARRRRK